MIRQGFADWLEQEQIPVIYEQRVQRVEKSGAAIVRLVLELAPPDKNGIPAPTATKKDASTIEAKVFIDASYEGDVMAAAGVKYAVGRESAEAYQEKLAGVGPTTNWTPIDPYVVPGDPKSGLLPFVDADHGLPKGAADDYTQAYNYRFYVTTDPAKRIAIEKPANYDAKDFELVGRFVEHLIRTIRGRPRKADEAPAGDFPRLEEQRRIQLQAGIAGHHRAAGREPVLSGRHLGGAVARLASAPGLPQRPASFPEHRSARARGLPRGNGRARARPDDASRHRRLAQSALRAADPADARALRPDPRGCVE